MLANITDLLEQSEQSFNIIEEFASLSAKRKILLCDHLFIEGQDTFDKTVKLLWSEATVLDIKKLEKFLHVLKRAAH